MVAILRSWKRRSDDLRETRSDDDDITQYRYNKQLAAHTRKTTQMVSHRRDSSDRRTATTRRLERIMRVRTFRSWHKNLPQHAAHNVIIRVDSVNSFWSNTITHTHTLCRSCVQCNATRVGCDRHFQVNVLMRVRVLFCLHPA